MTRLSVNINKIATLRNSEGGKMPNLLKIAADCETFGADGITVYPRPDGHHIRFQDIYDLRPVLKTEFNIEGYPSLQFIDLVLKIKPTQVTLVPNEPDDFTSNFGWNVKKNFSKLSEVVEGFREAGIRTSILIDTDLENIELAAKTGTDRIELHTGLYAALFPKNKEEAINPFIEAATMGKKLGLGINAGHDLTIDNLGYLCKAIPFLEEVSVGHAIICDALYLGIEKTIKIYKEQLKR